MRGKASIVPSVGCCKFLLATRSEVKILRLAVYTLPRPRPSPQKNSDDDNWGGGQLRFFKATSRDLWEIKTYRLQGSAVSRVNPLNPYIIKHIPHIVFRTFAMAVV